MRIKHTRINGRKIIYGQGTTEEVDELNRESNFEAALDVLQNMRSMWKGFLAPKNLLRWIGKYMGREKPVENDYRDFISALNKYGKEDLIKEGVK